ncbi:hypothetical protein DFQ28_000790 [Apophysomyces sp. BC1034]|nr:hypothetical protein DFQ30_000164 [Apophysomyces sp. BC1015]KAG0181378.1 hypothetical protein DFQ29_008516 [Apophysomyces sp. BC1021]KAG0191187.1 hypothetical protein DFQ28_000790 [Apophysomyces sp. BC1034]
MSPKKQTEDISKSQLSLPLPLPPSPPTPTQIDLVRSSWSRITRIRTAEDDPTTSAGHAFCLSFYTALFELDPGLQVLFNNVFQQARALAGMIAFIARVPAMSIPPDCINPDVCPTVLTIQDINASEMARAEFIERNPSYNTLLAQSPLEPRDEGEQLVCQFRELGARHYFYNLQPHHLSLAGTAILRALKDRLGKEYLPEVEEAWKRAYDFAAFHMEIGLDAQKKWEEGRRSSATQRFFDRGKNKSCVIQ